MVADMRFLDCEPNSLVERFCPRICQKLPAAPGIKEIGIPWAIKETFFELLLMINPRHFDV